MNARPKLVFALVQVHKLCHQASKSRLIDFYFWVLWDSSTI